MRLESQAPREDGSLLYVVCVSRQQHDLKSITPQLGERPHVVIVLDEDTWTVYTDEMLLNGESYATVPADAEELRIDVIESGYRVTADDKPIETGPITDAA